MNRFKNANLLDQNSENYIGDIALLQILVNERRAKLDMYNPLQIRLNRLAIDLDDLREYSTLKSVSQAINS